jgi:hypothetical protein
MIHFGDAGPYRIEGLERADKRTGRENFDLKAPGSRDADCLGKANRTGVLASGN